MNIINFILSVILILFISLSLYFIKYQAKNKTVDINHFPQYYATKYKVTNARTGPSTNYPIITVYKVKNTPVKARKNYNGWLEIEDIFGNVGWIKASLLLKKKTAVVITNNSKIYMHNSYKSKIIAYVEKVSIVFVKHCSHKTKLCKITIEIPHDPSYPATLISGWIASMDLWGATFQ